MDPVGEGFFSFGLRCRLSSVCNSFYPKQGLEGLDLRSRFLALITKSHCAAFVVEWLLTAGFALFSHVFSWLIVVFAFTITFIRFNLLNLLVAFSRGRK